MTAGLAFIAGGRPVAAVGLGLAMFTLQAAIGTANDLLDEPRDRGRKAGKPLPRGLLSRREAEALFGVLVVAGLGLTVIVAIGGPAGPALVVVAMAGLAAGLVYDVWLKGTIWSWLPFAVGVPLLPVYAWLGALGWLPWSFTLLVPTAILAGAALAVSNQLADLERDQSAGDETLATRLGRRRSWQVSALLHAVVLVVAAVTLLWAGGRSVGLGLVLVGMALIVIGLLVARRDAAWQRERGWELQAAGIGALGAGWFAALMEAGAL